jgi:PTS system nitrogen regulatory IIA component
LKLSVFAPLLASAMNIQDFLSPSDVAIDVAVANKQKLLSDLASKAGARLRLPPDRILSELSKREELGSTGVGDGVAIPHARFHLIDKPFGMLLRLRHPIGFDALDEKPIDLVFLLLLPESAKGEQLSALACVARKLKSPAIRAALRNAADTAEMFHLLASE